MVKFKAGQLILEDKPFAHILSVSQRGKRCDQCFKLCPNLRRCSQCKVKYYCSKSCQAEDWSSGHKLSECSIYANDMSKFNGRLVKTDDPRLVLRLLLLLTKKPELKTKTLGTNLNDGSPRSFNSLMDHKDDLLKDRNQIRVFEQMCYYYTSFGVSIDRDLVLSIFGRLMINGFNINDHTGSYIGVGIYIGASQFDHSCVPNVFIGFDGITLQSRAMTDIDTQLETMSVSYVDNTKPTDARRKELAEKYCFNCCCSRCYLKQDIDEGLFDRLQAELTQCLDEGNLIQMEKAANQLIPIYEEYSQFFMLTPLYMVLALKRRNAGYTLKDKTTKEIVEKLNSSILISHGTEHSVYKKDFIKLLRTLSKD